MDHLWWVLDRAWQWVEKLRGRGKREIAIVLAAGVVIGTILGTMVWRWAKNKYFYIVGYFRTAAGDGELDRSCARFLTISNPSYLTLRQRIKWEECQGMSAGFENSEEELGGRFVDVLSAYASSFYEIFGPLPLLIVIAYIVFYVLPSLFNKIETYGSSFWTNLLNPGDRHPRRHIPGEWSNITSNLEPPHEGKYQTLPDIRSSNQSNIDSSTHNFVTSLNGQIAPRAATTILAGSDNGTAEIQRLRGGNARLLRENIQLSNEMRTKDGAHRIQVSNLEAQLKYLRGQGSVINAQHELDTAYAQIRMQQGDIERLNLVVAGLQQQLDKEKTTHSGACKNEAGCSIKIRKLEGEKQLLLQMHQEIDIMVQGAAQVLGKPPDEAKHYTWEMLMREINLLVQEVLKKVAAYEANSTSNHSIFEFATDEMNLIHIQDLSDYASRLESELSRLGGDVQMIKLGLGHMKAQPHRDLTYEDNANTVFLIYLTLCKKIRYLSIMLVAENITPPPITAASPASLRNDFHDKPDYEVLGLFDRREITVKNFKFQDNESLLRSLLLQEITRLLDRGIELCAFIENLPKGDSIEWDEKVATPVRELQVACRNATMYILDDPRRLQTRTAPIDNSGLAAKAARRFKIWEAMQEAIRALTRAIKSFHRIPPAWEADPRQPPPSLVAKKSFESLVTWLMRIEINTLDHRIAQLLYSIEVNKLPGTTFGLSRSQGSLKYQEDYDALQAAKKFADLTKMHWAEEFSKGPRRSMYPLDHPPLLHAVRRQRGRVLVPQTSTFPWRMQKDGKLIDVGLGEILVEWKIPPAEEGEYAKLKRSYWRNYNRVQQLSRCLLDFDPKITTPHLSHPPNPGLHLDDLTINKNLPRLVGLVSDLEAQMRSRKLTFPEWPEMQYDMYASRLVDDSQ